MEKGCLQARLFRHGQRLFYYYYYYYYHGFGPNQEMIVCSLPGGYQSREKPANIKIYPRQDLELQIKKVNSIFFNNIILIFLKINNYFIKFFFNWRRLHSQKAHFVNSGEPVKPRLF